MIHTAVKLPSVWLHWCEYTSTDKHLGVPGAHTHSVECVCNTIQWCGILQTSKLHVVLRTGRHSACYWHSLTPEAWYVQRSITSHPLISSAVIVHRTPIRTPNVSVIKDVSIFTMHDTHTHILHPWINMDIGKEGKRKLHKSPEICVTGDQKICSLTTSGVLLVRLQVRTSS